MKRSSLRIVIGLSASIVATVSAYPVSDASYSVFSDKSPAAYTAVGATQMVFSSGGTLFLNNQNSCLSNPAGACLPVPYNGVQSYNGSAWSGLNTTGLQVKNGGITSLAVFRDTLFVGGTFDTIDGVQAAGIAKWVGGAWHGLGTNGKLLKRIGAAPVVNYLRVTDSGLLEIFGDFDSAFINNAYVASRNALMHYGNGTWGATSVRGNVTATSVAQRNSASSCQARYYAGRFDSLFGVKVKDFAYAISCPLGGSVNADSLPGHLVPTSFAIDTGYTYAATNTADSSISYVYRLDGTWKLFGAFKSNSGKTWIRSITLVDSGKLVVAGRFDTASGANLVPVRNIALLVPVAGSAQASSVALGSGANKEVYALAYDTAHKKIWFSGAFDSAGGLKASNLAFIDLALNGVSGIADARLHAPGQILTLDGNWLTSRIGGDLAIRDISGRAITTISVKAGESVRLDIPAGLHILSLGANAVRVFKP